MSQLVAWFWCQIGQWLEPKGMGALAGLCYRFAGSKGGRRGAEGLWRLGKFLAASDQSDEALLILQNSLEIDSANAFAWCDLGRSYSDSARFDEAQRCFEQALVIDGLNSDALTQIGELQLSKGNSELALDYFERVLQRPPAFHNALVHRVSALTELNRLGEAESAAREALKNFPESPACHVALGIVLARSGNSSAALNAYTRALEIQSNNQDALLNLAILKNDSTKLRHCLDVIRREIKLKGESAIRLGWLAVALKESGQLVEAEAIGRKLVAGHPDHATAWATLANCVNANGNPTLAVEYYRKALELNPNWVDIHSTIAFVSAYVPDQTPESIFKTHVDWSKRFEAPLCEKQFAHPPGDAEKHCLRIGYISGDFGTHPVGLLLRGVLQEHDHRNFEIHCFDTQSKETSDIVRGILRANSDRWHDVLCLSTKELADLIVAQGIDILVDLSGHTGDNRLQVFALKPAPVQVTWLGYFHSTGLSSIDYFISDPYTTPQQSNQLFSEALVRLPNSRFCYTPLDEVPDVAGPAFMKAGHITFGCFNRVAKLSDPVIEAWARIVLQVPAAKLLIKDWGLDTEEKARQLTNRFAAHGLPAERLILRPESDYLQMFEEYADIDIALDPFPYNGGMTTLDALWMGVPVVTLAGKSVVSRQSTSMLNNIGLEELFFPDVDSYVGGAVALALDNDRLTELRRDIRLRMSRSPLCDTEQFTRDLELLYRRMWLAWCHGEKLGPEIVPSASITRKAVLHVGCGPNSIRQLPSYFHRGWKEIRLDIDATSRPDILGTAIDMSAVSSHSVDAVYSSHMLEHLYAHELVIALAEMKRVLKSEGMLVVTVPDLQKVAQLIAADELLGTAYQSPVGPITPYDMVYGHRDFIESGKVYMAHRGGFTLTTLIDSIRKAGFDSVTGIRRETSFDLWVLATPDTTTDDRLNQLSAEIFP